MTPRSAGLVAGLLIVAAAAFGLARLGIATFARSGYVVLMPDFRGREQSQGVADDGYLSPVYTYDLLNLASTLKQDSRVDRTRIGLFGQSLGGDEALRAKGRVD